MRIGPGRLIAVVGPSGSGKDSLIRAAKAALHGKPVAFPRRVITREADAHENHIPVSSADFLEMETAGAFSLAWEAHGLCYGVPREIDTMLGDGLTVVLNVSRSIVPLLRERYSNLMIAAVSVDPQTLQRRLTDRGRETPQQIALRVARAPQEKLTGPDVMEIDNGGSLADAVKCFLATVASSR